MSNANHQVSWEQPSYVALSTTDSESSIEHSLEARPRRTSYSWKVFPYIVHLVLVSVYTIVYIFASHSTSVDALGIPYVQQTFEVNPHLNQSSARIYTGEPSEELEEAWHKLLKNANIRVAESEIARLGRLDNSVRFTDDSGYYGQMTVFHHLHCIKRIHKYLHIEHYWPDATTEELFMLRAHNFHCLDTLRQAIQCAGDPSLITFKWGTTTPVPSANWSSPHTCRDWEKLDEWNRERRVDVFQEGLVVHPTLGPAYGYSKDREGTGTVIE